MITAMPVDYNYNNYKVNDYKYYGLLYLPPSSLGA